MTAQPFGFVETFPPDDRARAEEMLAAIRATGATRLLLPLRWPEWGAEDGAAWLGWLLPTLAGAVDVVPLLHVPAAGRDAMADAVARLLDRLGTRLAHVGIWCPSVDRARPGAGDAEVAVLSGMAGLLRSRGHGAVLGGAFDALDTEMLGQHGLLARIDALAVPLPTGDGNLAVHVARMRSVLARHAPAAELWLAGSDATSRIGGELDEARSFASALEAPADRIYWSGWRGAREDGGIGAIGSDGRPRLLARLLMAGGPARLREVMRPPAPRLAKNARPAAITGGAGFVGANLADALLADGEEVLVIDSLARAGVEENLDDLVSRHGSRVHFAPLDIRQEGDLAAALSDASSVFHLAAQTAVTTSLAQPVGDFEVNARGTLAVLEAVRAAGGDAPVIFAGTNKVYGALSDLAMDASGGRHLPADPAIRAHGIAEDRPLDFCTPYGCSKGVADQYVLDYARAYGLPTAVLRMSCIYGPRQFGTEDQGWVAHFVIRALRGEGVAIYGDGRQVRDILHVSDAVRAYRLLREHIGRLRGRAFNLGGGPANAVSLRDVLGEIGRILGRPVPATFRDWRPGDQPYFVADTRALEAATGWRGRTGWREGLADLARWLVENRTGTRGEPRRLRA